MVEDPFLRSWWYVTTPYGCYVKKVDGHTVVHENYYWKLCGEEFYVFPAMGGTQQRDDGNDDSDRQENDGNDSDGQEEPEQAYDPAVQY